MKNVVLILCFLFTGASTHAQDAYDQSIGLRGGPYGGITYKKFIGVPAAIEGIVGFNYTNGRTYLVTGLFEYHVFISYRINIYAGAGIDIGGGKPLGAEKGIFRLGADAIVGGEYTFEKLPINFSIDYKPVYQIIQNEFFFNEFALSIRYIF